MRNKRVITIVAAMLSSVVALWADATIKVQAPNIVAADEQFSVAFIIEGEKSPSSFTWELGDAFQLVWGPQKGSSTSVSIVNGKTTRSSQSTYTYILQPKSTGRFTLPAATAVVKGETIVSKDITIEVLSSGQGSSSSQGGSQSQQQQSQGSAQPRSGGSSPSGDISSSDLFLKLSLSRTSVVVGEPITATLKLYQRVNIAGFEDAKFPTFNGFWSQEVAAPTNISFERENVGGQIYNAAVLRSWVVIPQQAGSIDIDPAELTCVVSVRSQTTGNSIFDSFFDSGYQQVRKRVLSERQTVKVSPLPAGAPETFCGGVGSFSVQAKVSRDSLKTHEAASVEVTVSGKGNISLVEAPKVALPLDFEAYDVKSTDLSDKSTGRTSGSRKFEYPFIPRSYGDFTIDPIEFTYYDVNAHKYVTISTQPLKVHVDKGADSDVAAQTGGQMIQGAQRRDVKDLGSDIRYIRTRVPSFEQRGAFLCASPLYWVLAVILLLAAVAVWFVRRETVIRRADVAGTRHRKASSMARKRLSAAGDFLKKDLYTAFYEELHKTLLGYVGDKLGMDLADMSKENIRERLIDAGASETLSGQYTDLLDACEYARYAPDAGHDAMQAHYETALSVISNIDDAMKGHKINSKGGTPTALIIVALLMCGVGASAQSQDYPDSLWSVGVEAYAAGEWDAALSAWQDIEELGVESSELYYNMGNACFKGGDYAHAIVWYERALKLDPSYADARNNLAFANGFVQDHIDVVPEFFVKTWIRKMSYAMSSDAWAVTAMVLFAVLLALVLVFILSHRSGARKAGFGGAIVALLLCVLALSFSLSQRSDYYRADSAIVTKPVTSARSTPGSTSSATNLFILHEGTKVRILDSVGQWNQIEISDGRQGWIPSADMEVI